MAFPLNPLTFPLHGSRLIEASAGTGKTYTIAALYLRLVLGHGNGNGFSRPLTPPEILVVTFTNAATEELRDRIRTRLTQAASFFRGMGDGDDFLKSLCHEYDAGLWPGNACLLDQAAQWMDESAIHTIHAWSQRMLSQHAVDSESLFDLELAASESDLLEEAACDYWRTWFYPLSRDRIMALKRLAPVKTPHDLLKKIRPLINARLPVPENPFDMLQKIEKTIEEARQCWESDFDTAADKVRKARENKTLNNNKYREDSLEGWLEQIRAWAMEKGSLPQDPALEKLSCTGLEKGVSKNRSAPVHPAYDALDLLNRQLKDLDLESALFRHAASDINQRVQLAKERLARAGFDDLLTRLGDALEKPGSKKLAQIIRRQYPVALIDEFQDTDPVQYTTFSRIYLGQPDTGLFMIGDPKQAIYGFRGADIHTYLNAGKDAMDRKYTLDTNFRSTDGMVQCVNQLFSTASGYPEGPFLFRDNIPFEPVRANGLDVSFFVDHSQVTGITLWHLDQTVPVNKNANDGYLAQAAQSSATEIVRLLNLAEQTPSLAGFKDAQGVLKRLRPNDIAILVRDVFEARAIRCALAERGLRSVYLSDKDSVFQSSEALSVLYVLQACADPGRERLVRTALAAPVLARPLSWIDQLNLDEQALDNEIERFRRYQMLWKQQGVLPMLRRLLHDFNVPQLLLAEPSGERELTNLLHLAELLQSAAVVLDGDQALIRWLAEQIEQPDNSSDDQILRLESDEELIRVVTIHKSKGLEYPLVFLPFICTCRKVTRRNLRVVRYHDTRGRTVIVENPGDDDLAKADRERLAEDLRMLYVAVTRSRHACWLGIGVIGKRLKTGEKNELHLCGPGYLISGGMPILTSELTDRLEALKGDCDKITITHLPKATLDRYQPGKQEGVLKPARTVDHQVPGQWWITSYSGIVAGAWLPMSGTERDDIPDVLDGSPDSASEDQLIEAKAEPVFEPDTQMPARTIHQFARGPEPGTFLHDLLEWAANQGFDTIVSEHRQIKDRLTTACRRRGWDQWADVLFKWLLQLLKTPLALPQATITLGELTRKDCQAELEFLFSINSADTGVIDDFVAENILKGAVRPRLHTGTVNGMIKGFIDLVFYHKGRYYIVDYKSNYLGENDQAYGSRAMADAMLAHRYDLQYVVYTLALHRLLKNRLENYDYHRDVGGAVYLFLRGVNTSGQGVYVDKPPRELIETLDDYVAGKEVPDGS